MDKLLNRRMKADKADGSKVLTVGKRIKALLKRDRSRPVTGLHPLFCKRIQFKLGRSFVLFETYRTKFMC